MAKAPSNFHRGLQFVFARYNSLSKQVDNVIGVSEINEAHNVVRIAENNFLDQRNDVQKLKVELEATRERLKEIRTKLDRCPREDERYLGFVTDEHNLVKEEKSIRSQLNVEEETERDKFALFSTAVRSSHEKERARTERTKYWSLIGSILGTVTGFTLSSILTHYRFKKIEELTPNAMLVDSTNEVLQKLDDQSKLLQKYTGNERVTEVNKEQNSDKFVDTETIINLIKHLEINHNSKMEEITEKLTNKNFNHNVSLSNDRQTILKVSDYENWIPDENLKFDNMPLQIYNTLLSRISLGLSLFSQGLLLYIVITGR